MDIEELQLVILKIKQEVCDILSEQDTGISLGYSLYPNDGTNFEELIKVADKNMYLEKDSKKSYY